MGPKTVMGPKTQQINGEMKERGDKAISAFDYKEVGEYFSDFSHFRSFGETILKYLNDDSSTQQYTHENLQKHLGDSFKEKGIDKSFGLGSRAKETYDTWFGDTIPDDREKGFALSFALDFCFEKTRHFIADAFFDREFDPKNYKEMIYYWCLANKKTWGEAQKLIEEVANKEVGKQEEIRKESATRFSCMIRDAFSEEALKNISKEGLVEKCLEIRQYEGTRNANLRKVAQECIDQAREEAKKERDEYNEFYCFFPQWEISNIEPKLNETQNEGEIKEKELFDIILGCSLWGEDERSSKSDLSFMKKYIINVFPNFDDINQLDKLSSKKLRNLIILMKSYCLWRTEISNPKKDFSEERAKERYENYVFEINNTLDKALTTHLYACNPYDGLFLVSAISGKFGALDNFRFLIDAAYSYEYKRVPAPVLKETKNVEVSFDDFEGGYNAEEWQQYLIKKYQETPNNVYFEELVESFFTPFTTENRDGKEGVSIWDQFVKNYFNKDDNWGSLKYINQIAAQFANSENQKNWDDDLDLQSFPMLFAPDIAREFCRDSIRNYLKDDKDIKQGLKNKVVDEWGKRFSVSQDESGKYKSKNIDAAVNKISEKKPGDITNGYDENKGIIDLMGYEKDRAILKYRFGTGECYSCYNLNSLKEILREKEGMAEVTKGDILNAEKRFIRFKRRSLLESIYLKR